MDRHFSRADLFFWLRIPHKRVNTRLMVVGVMLMALTAISCGITKDDQPTPESDPAPRPVRVSQAEIETLSRTVDYVGTVEPVNQLQVTARLGASVVDLYAEEGDKVAAGDPMLRMESPELHAQIDRLQADVERARGDREYHCHRFETDRDLADAGVGTRAQADKSESQCMASQQGLAAAQATLHEVRQRRDYLREVAPLDGVVLKRLIESGEHVSPGRPLYTIGSAARHVEVMVTEKDVATGIDVGQPVRLTSSMGEVSSQIADIAPVVRGPGRTIEVRVDVPREWAESLWVGMSVDVAFVLEASHQAVTVPVDAVLETPQGPAVFVVEEARLHRTPVEVGVRTDRRVEITENLSPGQVVATGRLEPLSEGDEIYAVDVSGGEP